MEWFASTSRTDNLTVETHSWQSPSEGGWSQWTFEGGEDSGGAWYTAASANSGGGADIAITKQGLYLHKLTVNTDYGGSVASAKTISTWSYNDTTQLITVDSTAHGYLVGDWVVLEGVGILSGTVKVESKTTNQFTALVEWGTATIGSTAGGTARKVTDFGYHASVSGGVIHDDVITHVDYVSATGALTFTTGSYWHGLNRGAPIEVNNVQPDYRFNGFYVVESVPEYNKFVVYTTTGLGDTSYYMGTYNAHLKAKYKFALAPFYTPWTEGEPEPIAHYDSSGGSVLHSWYTFAYNDAGRENPLTSDLSTPIQVSLGIVGDLNATGIRQARVCAFPTRIYWEIVRVPLGVWAESWPVGVG